MVVLLQGQTCMMKFHTWLFPKGNKLVSSAVSNSMAVDLTIQI